MTPPAAPTTFSIPDPRYGRWAWVIASLWQFVETITHTAEETSLDNGDRASLCREAR